MARAPLHWLLHALGLRAADTQTTAAERACLARHAAGKQMLVEIGVMHGVSTRLLCEAMAPDGVLTAIDPFPAGRLGWSVEYAIAQREVARAPRRSVVWRRERSEHVAATWSEGIDFLFIDGDHSWTGIHDDWTMWSRFVVEGGVVLLHDSRPVAGARHDSVRYTSEVILQDHRFSAVDAVDSLTVLQRDVPVSQPLRVAGGRR
jgi:predicted O-methyltransferase YrrM